VSVIFFILALLENFFINRPLGKLIPYMDLGNGATVAGALGALQGASLTGTLPVHVDRPLPQWIEGRH
jgi:hypothetical protein